MRTRLGSILRSNYFEPPIICPSIFFYTSYFLCLSILWVRLVDFWILQVWRQPRASESRWWWSSRSCFLHSPIWPRTLWRSVCLFWIMSFWSFRCWRSIFNDSGNFPKSLSFLVFFEILDAIEPRRWALARKLIVRDDLRGDSRILL